LHILRDLRSRNGVFMNGVAIQESPLAPGHILRLGEWVGVVVLTSVDVAQAKMSTCESAFAMLAPGVAGGPVLRPIFEQLQRAASSTLPIVLSGETGTGKEGGVRAIHAWSERRGPLIAVNCAALPPSLAEAEFFGYRKGAFTGAERAQVGHFRAAHGGTLFLDEIADLAEPLQGKLLRALEQHEVMPLGESTPVPVDVRIVAATQVPLAQAVAQRRFRPDLCARLEGLTVVLPPLRERREEIPYLFSHLLSEHSGGRPPGVEPRLIEQLCLYDWPFNVRELDLLVRRLLVLHAHEGWLRRSQLPEHMRVFPDQGLPARIHHSASTYASSPADPAMSATSAIANTPDAHRERRERELAALIKELRAQRGNVARAAAATGISRQRAYRLMQDADSRGNPEDLRDDADDRSNLGSRR
jgi:transcriptional regulator with PAS, ATPase and Fis domain